MHAGELRHRVRIERDNWAAKSPSIGQDQLRQPVPNWEPVATRWAAIEPLSGRELWQAQQVQADVTHRVTMRHTVGRDSNGNAVPIGPKMRLVYPDGGRDRIFNILWVTSPEERRRELVFLCVEQVK